MKLIFAGGLVAVALTLSLAPAAAQEQQGPELRENVLYYRMTLVDFKPGMDDEAWEIIYEHFVPADRASGRNIINFDIQTGGWDHVVYFETGDNTDEWEYSRSPANVAWWSALIEQEGSEEAAMELMARYRNTVARSETHLVHRHMDTE